MDSLQAEGRVFSISGCECWEDGQWPAPAGILIQPLPTSLSTKTLHIASWERLRPDSSWSAPHTTNPTPMCDHSHHHHSFLRGRGSLFVVQNQMFFLWSESCLCLPSNNLVLSIILSCIFMPEFLKNKKERAKAQLYTNYPTSLSIYSQVPRITYPSISPCTDPSIYHNEAAAFILPCSYPETKTLSSSIQCPFSGLIFLAVLWHLILWPLSSPGNSLGLNITSLPHLHLWLKVQPHLCSSSFCATSCMVIFLKILYLFLVFCFLSFFPSFSHLLAVWYSMRDHSSPTRDCIQAPCIGSVES